MILPAFETNIIEVSGFRPILLIDYGFVTFFVQILHAYNLKNSQPSYTYTILTDDKRTLV